MSRETAPDRPFPLLPLIGAGSLILISLLSVAWVRWFDDSGSHHAPVVETLQSKSLFFVDKPTGEVDVIDAGSNKLITVLPVGEHGFIRSTLRGMARARKARGVGAETPFTLEQRQNGQLLLIDTVTGQAIDLWAFGIVNARSFAEFLNDERTELTEEHGGQAGTLTMNSNTATRAVEESIPYE